MEQNLEDRKGSSERFFPKLLRILFKLRDDIQQNFLINRINFPQLKTKQKKNQKF